MRALPAAVCLSLLLIAPLSAQDLALSGVLIDGEGWQLVGEGYQFTEGPAVDATGQVFFTDIPHSKIYKVDLEGKVSVFVEESGKTNGLMFGGDGKLYGCRGGERQIVRYHPAGDHDVLATDVDCNDLVVTKSGAIFFTDPPGGKLWHINPQGEKRVVAEGLKPNGVILWPDQGTLVTTDALEPHLWTFRVEADGGLKFKDRYYGPLRLLPGADRPGSDGMTVDSLGRLYVATRAGVQMFDPTGRMGGVILKPTDKSVSNVCFGGPELNYLYATCTDKVFRRKTQAKGVRYFDAK